MHLVQRLYIWAALAGGTFNTDVDFAPSGQVRQEVDSGART